MKSSPDYIAGVRPLRDYVAGVRPLPVSPAHEAIPLPGSSIYFAAPSFTSYESGLDVKQQISGPSNVGAQHLLQLSMVQEQQSPMVVYVQPLMSPGGYAQAPMIPVQGQSLMYLGYAQAPNSVHGQPSMYPVYAQAPMIPVHGQSSMFPGHVQSVIYSGHEQQLSQGQQFPQGQQLPQGQQPVRPSAQRQPPLFKSSVHKHQQSPKLLFSGESKPLSKFPAGRVRRRKIEQNQLQQRQPNPKKH